MSGSVLYRPVNMGDMGFILKTWIRDFRKSPWSGPYEKELKTQIIKETIEETFNVPSTTTIIASLEDVKDQIFGFCCFDPKKVLVHYLYVKPAYRRMRIGRDLLSIASKNKPFAYTHKTRFHRFYGPDARYRPDALWRKAPSRKTIQKATS